MEDGASGVLYGLGVAQDIGYCGKELLKGASSLGDAGRIFNLIYSCCILFHLLLLFLIHSDNTALMIHDRSQLYT